jgi:hypothetical protein
MSNAATEIAIGTKIGTSDGLYGVIVGETKCYWDANVDMPGAGPQNTVGVVRMRINKKTGNHYNGTNRYFFVCDWTTK